MFMEQFTSSQVIERTGITPRQLQWWDERGVVVPARAGRRRVYSTDDLAEVAVICELRQRGFSLQRVRKLMRLLQREFGRRLAQTVSGGDYHLLTDGQAIYVQTSAEQVIDVLRNARQPLLAIALSDTVRRVTGVQRGPAVRDLKDAPVTSVMVTRRRQPRNAGQKRKRKAS